jgi:hypothetical protein
MSVAYLETSALLAWLLGEAAGSEVGTALAESGQIVTSVMTVLEARRALVRAETDGLLDAAQAAHLRGIVETLEQSWHLMEVSAEVRERASSRFPVEPVRSLDAIHLATALIFARAFADMRVLSLDGRIRANLTPLGLG